MVTSRVFGTMPDGREVKLYRIENKFGEYAEICDLGVVIHALCVLDREGNIGDTVLGCPDVENMLGKSFKAATIGRCANRIAYGKCVLDGRELQLDVTDRGVNFIHGGSGNWAFRLFDAEVESATTVAFRYTDNGEGGFGNRCEVCVRMSFDDEHRLSINYNVTPEGTTVISPTNHAYFNLDDFRDVRDHEFTLLSHNLARLGASRTPEGGLVPVLGTAADFTKGRTLRECMESDPAFFERMGRPNYDDFFVLDREREDNLVAVLYSPRTGRRMNTYTDMQCAIIYTPAGCTGKHPDKTVEELPDYAAICIETQFVPNAVNVPEFDSPVFRAGEKFVSTTVYEFEVVK